MTWQAGRWNHTNGQCDVPPEWGTLKSFSVTYGRPVGALLHQGAVCHMVFEDGPAWRDYRPAPLWKDPVARVDGVAIRWNPDGHDWHGSGPPVVFAGHVRDAEVRVLPDGTGDGYTLAHVTARDLMATYNQMPVSNITPEGVWPMLRRLFSHGYKYPPVRFGTPVGLMLSTDADHYADYDTLGQLLNAIRYSTGAEVFMRHGRRIDWRTPPEFTPGFGIRAPELVLRALGGPTYQDAERIVLYYGESDFYDTDGGYLLSDSFTVDGFSSLFASIGFGTLGFLSRPAEIRVSSSDIIDSVTLTSQRTDVDGNAETVTVQRADAPYLPRGLLDRGSLLDHDHTALELAANRWLDNHGYSQRRVTVTIPDLSPDEITRWAQISLADKLILDSSLRVASLVGGDAATDAAVADVAEVTWDVDSRSATLTLGLTVYEQFTLPPPPPAVPVILWTATLGIRSDDDSNDTGWSVVGEGDYGILTDHTIDTPDGEVLLDAIRWSPLSSTLWIWADTGQDAARLDGLWMQIGDTISGQLRQAVPPGGRQLRLNPAPSSLPWQQGDYLTVRVSDIEPADTPAAAAQPLMAGIMTVGAAGTNRGYQTGSFGAITDNDFPLEGYSGEFVIIDRLHERTTATNDMRLEFRTVAMATAAEGLWLRCAPGVSYRLAAANRTSARYVWDETPDPSWETGSSVIVEIWDVEPTEDQET